MFVFVENLAYYNEGKIIGDWFQLGKSDEELQCFLNDVVCIDKTHEEYFIADIESDNLCYSVNSYCDLFELNRLVCQFNELSEEEQMTVNALLETGIFNRLEDALYNVEHYQLIQDIHNEYDLGYYFLENCNFYDMPEFILNYIDYESYGRDILLSGDGDITKYGYLMTA